MTKLKKEKFKIGDIFSIDLHNGEFAFGRCLTYVEYGHIVEIFDYFSTEETFEIEAVPLRLFPPILINSYTIFIKKKTGKDWEGNWKVISNDKNFVINDKDIDNVFFSYGTGPTRFVVNIFGETVGTIDKEEDFKYLPYSPASDPFIVSKILNHKK